MKKGVLLAVSVISLLPYFTDAQSFYAIRRERTLIAVAGTGTSSYFGELKNDGEYIDPKLNIAFGLQQYFSNRISARVEFTYFTLRGDDANADDGGSRTRRNLSFTSGNFELSATGMVNLFPNGHRFYQRATVNFYPFAGLGLAFINPRAELDGTKYALQPLRTEGVKYSRLQPVIPFGLGARLKMGPFFNLSIEGGWRLTFTDYLDDVSTVYPDLSTLESDIARQLSMRYAEPPRPDMTGFKRGNPEKNDAYFLLNAKIEYYLPYNFFAGDSNRKLYKNKRRNYRRR